MDNFFEQLNQFMQKAYFYIPAILAFITAVGLPSLVQIAKIVAYAKVYLAQASRILKKMNETVEQVNAIADFVLSSLDEDAAFFEELATSTYNKKQKEAYLAQASRIRSKRQRAIGKIEILKEDVETAKNKVKVKVRIKE